MSVSPSRPLREGGISDSQEEEGQKEIRQGSPGEEHLDGIVDELELQEKLSDEVVSTRPDTRGKHRIIRRDPDKRHHENEEAERTERNSRWHANSQRNCH
jgi:hypothetical protein